MLQLTSLPPLSLYIHIPWCVQKCPYCDFNSHTVKTTMPETVYIQALLTDLEQELPSIWGRTIQSIFIGGGTPSLFSADTLDQLFSSLRSHLMFAADIEITLEANPGTVEQSRFRDYRAIGINRLSIGIQSFANDKLEALGRIHNAEDAIRAAETAQQSGFDNFNLDLMFALPGQNTEQAIEDLQQAIALQPSHISWYQLTIEPNTLFYHQSPALPDEDQAWNIYQQGQRILAEAGYEQYEISAYARNKQQCQHNLNYWQFGDYIGIGAGAHGKISNSAEQSITRRQKLKQPDDYIKAAKTQCQLSQSHKLSPEDIQLEFMMNALRLNQGFTTELFSQHTGLNLEAILPALTQAKEKGWLDISNKHIAPSQQGRLFLNDLLALFMP